MDRSPLLLFRHLKQSSLFTYLPHLSFLWKSAPLLCKSFIHSTLLERIDGPESVNLAMGHIKSLFLDKYDNYPNMFKNIQLKVEVWSQFGHLDLRIYSISDSVYSALSSSFRRWFLPLFFFKVLQKSLFELKLFFCFLIVDKVSNEVFLGLS